ncbi:MAG TPA: cupin domain-containing protein [Caulobacteraceae bacterium]|jgi:uncharacterized cupin superfamily protein
MPKIDLDAAPAAHGTGYPEPYDQPCRARRRWRLGDAAGLDQFGVNLLELKPGTWSSQRHWHTAEDEFVWVLEGEVVLVEEDGETVLRPGDCAGFKAGTANGHHLQNRSDALARVLEVGARRKGEDGAFYPGIDLVYPVGGNGYLHEDGTPYPPIERRT